MTRATLYCRISQDDGTALGVARQEADCRALVSSRGWTVAGVHTDNNISASSGAARPGWQAALASLVAGEADALVSYSADRWSRNADELAALYRTARALGVALTTVSGGDVDVTSSTGKFRAHVDAGVAQLETDRLSERQRRKMKELAQAGKPHGGVRPYGFAPDRVTHDPHEAAVIREVAARVLAGGSVRGACLMLNARGDLTSTGKPWEPMVMRRMLLSPRLIGMREHRGQVMTAVWEPVLPREQQILLRARLTARRRGAMHRHLLSGVSFCGVCGAKVRYTGATRGNAPTYHCPPRPRGMNCVSIRAEAAEKQVIDVVLAFGHIFTSEQTGRLTEADPAARARDELATVQNAYKAGKLSLNDYMDFGAHWEREITVMNARADALVAAAARKAEATSLGQRWPTMTDAERRLAIARHIDRIVLHPKRAGDTVAERIEVVLPPELDEEGNPYPEPTEPTAEQLAKRAAFDRDDVSAAGAA